MKELLFSSWGFCAPQMRNTFARVIPRGEGLQEKICLVIPYAGFDPVKTFEREREGLVAFGFDAANIRLVECPQDITAQRVDYIYVPGGDPFKLLDTMRKMELTGAVCDAVKKHHTVYIGVSAGADIATPDIAYVTLLEDNNVLADDFTALGLVEDSLLCHYDHYGSVAVIRACKEKSGGAVRTLNDDQLLRFKNGSWEYIGEEG